MSSGLTQGWLAAKWAGRRDSSAGKSPISSRHARVAQHAQQATPFLGSFPLLLPLTCIGNAGHVVKVVGLVGVHPVHHIGESGLIGQHSCGGWVSGGW